MGREEKVGGETGHSIQKRAVQGSLIMSTGKKTCKELKKEEGRGKTGMKINKPVHQKGGVRGKSGGRRERRN